ncbi:DUF3850 domain-containing protein [Paenibacillus oleatilyticus]|uniref:DUF3850 domain-containing protein n=1 Tax=Paenibacillus oleatilyticus TaxID=2594886 RepID=A0ABV4UX85_9BACL
MNRVHEVKTLPQYFEPAATGIKKFTIRKNDRNYQVGDTLLKREWHSGAGYTGREAVFTITYITEYGQQPGFVVMGIELQRVRDWNKANSSQYTPEQITELLENTNNAIQLGYYPEFERIKQLTEIVQQQAAEPQKAYDNLLAEAEALGEQSSVLKESLSAVVDELKSTKIKLEEEQRVALYHERESYLVSTKLAMVVETLKEISQGERSSIALAHMAADALVRIKASQETE